MRAMIHSTKHYVQMSRFTVGTVATVHQDLVLSVAVQNKDAVDEVVEGATLKAVFVELWIIDAGAGGSFIVTLHKDPSGVVEPTFAQTNALNNWENKKNLLYTTQGLASNDGIAQPQVLLRQWFKIPKSKQRFGLGDKLKLSITNNGTNDLFACGFSTYKEYT